MRQNIKYAIIGTGAIGGYYGAKLAHAGADVQFLLHSDYQYVCQNGLQINSYNGNFHLDNPQVAQNTTDMSPADIIIVALKTTNQHLLKQLLPPILKPSTLILLIQNGIGVEQDVLAMLPNTQLVAGLAFICSSKTKPGTVDHQFYGNINLAPYNVSDSDAFNGLVSDFRDAQIETAVVKYAEARWKKALWNMPFNGMTVVLNCQTNDLISTPSNETMIRDLMKEVVCAAQASGANLSENDIQQTIDLTKAMLPYSPSMKLDYDFHRPMEINYLYSRPIEIAEAAGYEMRQMKLLEAMLKAKDVK